MTTPTENQTGIDLTVHPDNEENELADDAEVDALIEGISTDAPVLTSEENI